MRAELADLAVEARGSPGYPCYKPADFDCVRAPERRSGPGPRPPLPRGAGSYPPGMPPPAARRGSGLPHADDPPLLTRVRRSATHTPARNSPRSKAHAEHVQRLPSDRKGYWCARGLTGSPHLSALPMTEGDLP